MKKLFTLIAVMTLVTMEVNAQRITNLTFAGVTPLSKFCALTPGTSTAGAPPGTSGDIQFVFPQSVDLTNLLPTPTYATNTVLTSPSTFPTDYSVNNLVTLNDIVTNTNSAYKLTIKKINPITLQGDKVSFDFKTAWSQSTTLGWATACADPDLATGNCSIGSANRSIILAFNNAPSTITYMINVAATTWNAGNVFDIEESADGLTWTSVTKYDSTNPMPLSTALTAEKTKTANLLFTTRYVRFIYTVRIAANVTVSTISVTPSSNTNTAISSSEVSSVKAFIIDGTKMLNIVNADEVVRIEVVNMVNQLMLSSNIMQNGIDLNGLSSGAYIIKMMLNNGKTIASKVVLK